MFQGGAWPWRWRAGRLLFARRGRVQLDGKSDLVRGGRVVAELEIEGRCGAVQRRPWHGQRRFDEAFRHGGRGGEAGVRGYSVDQIEGRTFKCAGSRRDSGAVELRKRWQTHDGGQRKPLAGSAGGVDRAHVERSEGRRPKGLQRVKGGEDGVGILQDERPGGDRQRGLERVVQARDLDFFGPRKGCTGFQEKEQLVAERQVSAGGDLDRRGRGRAAEGGNTARKIADRGPRGKHDRGNVEGPAILKVRLGGEFLVGLEVEGFGVCRHGKVESARLRGWGRREGKIAHGEGLDLVEAGAGEGGGGVAGVKLERLDAGRFGEGAGAQLVGLAAAELLDGEMDGAGSGGVLQVKREVDRVDRDRLTGLECGRGYRFGRLLHSRIGPCPGCRAGR